MQNRPRRLNILGPSAQSDRGPRILHGDTAIIGGVNMWAGAKTDKGRRRGNLAGLQGTQVTPPGAILRHPAPSSWKSSEFGPAFPGSDDASPDRWGALKLRQLYPAAARRCSSYLFSLL